MRINSVEPTFANITDNFDGFSGSPDGLGMTVRTLGDDLATPQAVSTVSPTRNLMMAAYAVASLAGVVGGDHARRAPGLDPLDHLRQTPRDPRTPGRQRLLDARRREATRLLLRSVRVL